MHRPQPLPHYLSRNQLPVGQVYADSELHPNGAVAVDDQGMHVHTYGNEVITNLPRVFTGFVWQPDRTNMGFSRGGSKIDPIRMVGRYLDAYLKPILQGGYRGGGEIWFIMRPMGYQKA